MTTTVSRQAVVAFWAAQLGCSEVQLAQPHTSVVRAGPELASWRGATVVFRPPACVLAVPADWYEPVVSRVGQRPPVEVFGVTLLREVFGAEVDQVIGPAWLGYADTSDLRPAPTLGTRLLIDQDLPELQRLAADCGPTAWEHSGIDPARPPVFGCFAGERLAAAGMLERWGDRLLHVGVVTHPGYRGRGYGKAVVSAMSAMGWPLAGCCSTGPWRPTSPRLGSPGRWASSASPSPWPCGSPRPVDRAVCCEPQHLPRRIPWGHTGATVGPRTTGSQGTTAVNPGPVTSQLTRPTPRPPQVAVTRSSSLARRKPGVQIPSPPPHHR
jgi:GNAT superfamily N-acetyltransferase